MTTADRLTMTLGEAMFTQRAIRRLKPDPIPDEVMRDIMESAIRAPNGGNTQQWHFIVVKNAETRKQLGELYHEAWWAKRKDQGIMGPEDIPPGKNSTRSAMRLANEFGDFGDGPDLRPEQRWLRWNHPVGAEPAFGGQGLWHRRHHCNLARSRR